MSSQCPAAEAVVLGRKYSCPVNYWEIPCWLSAMPCLKKHRTRHRRPYPHCLYMHTEPHPRAKTKKKTCDPLHGQVTSQLGTINAYRQRRRFEGAAGLRKRRWAVEDPRRALGWPDIRLYAGPSGFSMPCPASGTAGHVFVLLFETLGLKSGVLDSLLGHSTTSNAVTHLVLFLRPKKMSGRIFEIVRDFVFKHAISEFPLHSLTN